MHVLEFEKHIEELESKLNELRHLSGASDSNIVEEVGRLERKVSKLLTQTYSKLTPWQKVMVARHPNRPHFKHYVQSLITDFTPLAGDRVFGEDAAILGGLGRFQGQPVVILGHEKGEDTDARIHHNFGMARPEGYRKAQRLMKLADQFSLPIIVLIDTPGAHPGIDAEARGQSEAIAMSMQVMTQLRVPVLAVVTGEGMSGGAIAVGLANEVYMLEHSIYSVISPEGCASILWRTRDKREEAASTMRLTAQDLQQLDIIDKVIREPLGGAHRHHAQAIAKVAQTLSEGLERFGNMSEDKLRTHRRQKFLNMGKTGLA
ncbi:acetyl-CoA carboxylase carboxyltransferase subunit alpha [Alphaproteobacteria bacterium]|nr:acetyl-CoA carboxylase carboxyltransferase subunit alpha [Alphaproteobacteria bacterium]